MSLKSLNATSEMLARASKQVDKRIADHLVNIAEHINGAGNGDVSAANYFFSLLTSTSGIRKDAIGNWLIAYAGCSWNGEKKKFGRKKDFQFDLRLAVENPWFVFTKQREFKPFDLEAAIRSIINKAHKALEDEEHPGEHKVSKELLRKIEALSDPEKDSRKAEDKAPEGWAEVPAGLEHLAMEELDGEASAEVAEVPEAPEVYAA